MFGLSFKNAAGNVIISSETSQYHFIGKASRVPGSEVYLERFNTHYQVGSDTIYLTYPNGVRWYMLTIEADNPPLCFLYQGTTNGLYASAVLSVADNQDGTYAITVVQNYPEGSPLSLSAVEVYCFQLPHNFTSTEDQGLQMFDAGGALSFHHAQDFLKIKGVAELPHWDSYSGLLYPHTILGLNKAAAPVYSNISAASATHSETSITGYVNTRRVCKCSSSSCACRTVLTAGGAYGSLNYIQNFRHLPAVYDVGIGHHFAGAPHEVVEQNLTSSGVQFPPYNSYTLPVIDGADYD
jgi:hypothetical protein